MARPHSRAFAFQGYGVVMLDDCECEFDYVEPDGAQNPSPCCGWIDTGKHTPMQLLFRDLQVSR